MQGWWRRLRGALGMGVTWAVLWAIGGVLIAAGSVVLPWLPWDAFFRIFDAPAPALAVPGFFGGVLFSVVLGVAARNRRFEELSLRRFALLGALGGLLLSLLPTALVLVGLATLTRPDTELWRLTATLSVPLVLLASASASGTLLLARRAERSRSAGEISSG